MKVQPIGEDVQKSFFVPLMPCVVRLLGFLSIYNQVALNIWKAPERIPFWFTELYVLAWTGLISVGLIFVPNHSRIYVVLVFISIYRLQDISSALARKIFIEHATHHDEAGHYIIVRHVERWIILAFINVFEIVQCFAVLYLFWGRGFDLEIRDSLTAIYQSILTVTTLGYGEIHANSNESKILVVCQLFYFLGYFLLILPRIFSCVRLKEAVQGTAGQTQNAET